MMQHCAGDVGEDTGLVRQRLIWTGEQLPACSHSHVSYHLHDVNHQIHKYKNTQIHKYTNTQMHKYTNAQIHKQIQKYMHMVWLIWIE